MKLKCDAHGRRVLSGKTSFLHRTGDMSVCDSSGATASMIDNTSHITRKYRVVNGEFIHVSTDKVSRPHTKHKE